MNIFLFCFLIKIIYYDILYIYFIWLELLVSAQLKYQTDDLILFCSTGQNRLPWLWRGFPTCPHLMCEPIPVDMPDFCIIPGSLMFQGWSLCKSCDIIYSECLPENLPRQPAGGPSRVGSTVPGSGIPTQQNEVPPCVHVSCPSFAQINKSCIREGSIIEFEGAQCRDCDYVDPFCEGLNLDICQNHIVDCTGVPKSAPKKCIEQSVIQFNNNPCLSCPFLKTEDPECNTPDLRRCPGLKCADLSQVSSACVKEGRMVRLGSSQCHLCPEIDTQNPACNPLSAAPKRSLTPVSLCPNSYCPPLAGIPQNCITEGELSSYEGTACRKCAVIDPFCPGLNLQICQNHILDCWGAPTNTPNRCKSQSVISFGNRACLTCPYFKTEEVGCIEESYNICPGIQCSEVRGVPYRCLRQPSQLSGSQCATECPSRVMAPGCPMPPRRPPQALPATPAQPTPRAPTRPFNPQLCPALMCPDMPRNVPKSCLRPGVIMGMNGQECPGCPQVDRACQLEQLDICENLLPTCGQVPQGLPARCYDQSTVSYNGRRCLTCPEVRPMCRRSTVLT